ncbi:ABC transporter substrate-binding protein [Cohnella yongneupensis]|uniref:ABC transporter substrate-binding protein n=1 Tax=Cohnella yongneupensis TaxID=425006 RepID=A0ABW0R515_9BACL
MRGKWSIVILLTMVLASVILAGCSDQPKTEFDNAEITVLVQDQGNSALGKQINALLDDSKALVEKESPGIIVHLVRVPPEQYADKIKELKPDIYWFAPFELALPQSAGKLYDLNPLLDNAGLDITQYFPRNVLDMTTVDGKLLGMTLSAYNITVGYSKSWFDNAGIPYPQNDWTWEDFESAAVALKSANGGDSSNVYGAGIPLYSEFVEPIVMGMEGAFLSPDGTQASGYLDGPATVNTVEWLKGLLEQGVIDKQYNGDVAEIGVKRGMAVTLSPLISSAAQTNPDIGIVALPSMTGEAQVSAPYITAFGINASSVHPDAALKYIYALTLEDNEVTRQAFRLGISVSSAVFAAIGDELDPSLTLNYNLLPFAQKRASMVSREYSLAMGQYENTFSSMIQTDMEIAPTLTQIAQGIDSKLAEARIKDEEEAQEAAATQSAGE